MFGFSRRKRVVRAADDFVQTLAKRVDSGYRIFVRDLVQILADVGISIEEIELFASNEMTKVFFLVGECGSQMVASENLFGKINGKALNEEIVRMMNNYTMKCHSFQSERDLWQILDHCREFPMSLRVTVFLYILQCLGLENTEIHSKTSKNELIHALINSTSLTDGIIGVCKEIEGRNPI